MRHIVTLMVALVLLAATSMFSARNYSGEVATLYTTDRDGRVFETQLWVLEDHHELWIRSNRATSQWLDRLIQNPEIQLSRDGVVKNYIATPLAHRRAHINALSVERYGWAEWILTNFENRDETVPVFLDPFV
jgi:hypothetical protein